MFVVGVFFFFVFKQKTAYEMRISDWSSDVCSSDLSQGTVTPTAAPSMDIQVSSNFERLLFDLGGRDGKALAEQMAGFETTRAMQLTNAQREGDRKSVV